MAALPPSSDDFRLRGVLFSLGSSPWPSAACKWYPVGRRGQWGDHEQGDGLPSMKCQQ